jgi:molybdate transport system ATP-binding protein
MLDISICYQRDNFKLVFSQQIKDDVVGLFGPSGAGKTTLLSLIGGLLNPQAGHILLNGECLFDSAKKINIPAHKRSIATVFQDGRLFPHLSIKDNLLYGFNLLAEGQQHLHLSEVVDLLELEAMLNKQPHQLSGGEAQRVAFGRGLMMSPKLLLLDEPLSSLDGRLKQQILPFLKRVKDEMQIPMIYVSHDIGEIKCLTDKVITLQH